MRAPAAAAVSRYAVSISDATDEPAWDDFLENAPGGHHAQTSCWGRARASIGWVPVRVLVSEDGRIVAGAQMVTRPMPLGGNIGFVTRGPVIPAGRPDLAGVVYDELLGLGRARNVGYLVVQPPRGGHWMCTDLEDRGFRYGAFDIDHTSTVLIDLTPDLDEIFAKLSKPTRKHIKEGERYGIKVRRGTEADVAIFNELKDVHSARLGYPRREGDYYFEMWKALAPRGHVEVFVAEYDGEPVTAQLAIPFGDTYRHMERPWSGKYASKRPNELIKWEVIKWAKEQGYRYADLEGIEPAVASAALAGEPIPDDPNFSASKFKLKFAGAGEIVVDPPSYDYVYNPLLRLGYRCIPVSVMRSARMRRLLFKFRETGS